MNKLGGTLLGVLITLGILIFLGISIAGSYNSLVNADLDVQNKWANVETAYQRRIDLIPNIVRTVQASADFERRLQTEVAGLRSGVSSATSPSDLQKLDNRIASSINLVFESYPQIRSTEGFLELQSQLEGTENRIKVERDRYNEAVRNYKSATLKFPRNLFANIFGFNSEKYKMFESEDGAEKAPEVNFNFN